MENLIEEILHEIVEYLLLYEYYDNYHVWDRKRPFATHYTLRLRLTSKTMNERVGEIQKSLEERIFNWMDKDFRKMRVGDQYWKKFGWDIINPMSWIVKLEDITVSDIYDENYVVREDIFKAKTERVMTLFGDQLADLDCRLYPKFVIVRTSTTGTLAIIVQIGNRFISAQELGLNIIGWTEYQSIKDNVCAFDNKTMYPLYKQWTNKRHWTIIGALICRRHKRKVDDNNNAPSLGKCSFLTSWSPWMFVKRLKEAYDEDWKKEYRKIMESGLTQDQKETLMI